MVGGSGCAVLGVAKIIAVSVSVGLFFTLALGVWRGWRRGFEEVGVGYGAGGSRRGVVVNRVTLSVSLSVSLPPLNPPPSRPTTTSPPPIPLSSPPASPSSLRIKKPPISSLTHTPLPISAEPPIPTKTPPLPPLSSTPLQPTPPSPHSWRPQTAVSPAACTDLQSRVLVCGQKSVYVAGRLYLIGGAFCACGGKRRRRRRRWWRRWRKDVDVDVEAEMEVQKTSAFFGIERVGRCYSLRFLEMNFDQLSSISWRNVTGFPISLLALEL